MKITKEQIFDVKAALEALAPHVRGVRLSYLIAYNLGKLKTVFTALQAATKPSDSFTEYDKGRRSVLSKLAPKDEDGNPSIINGQYFIPDPIELDRALAPLKKKFEKTIAEREEQLEEIKVLMKEEVEVDFRKIYIEDMEAKAVAPDAPGLAPFLQPLMEAGIVAEGKPEEKPEEKGP